MDYKELAELKRTGYFDKIAEYGDSNELDSIDDSDKIIFVAEAYRKVGRLTDSVNWYKKALIISWEDTAAVNLIDIYKKTNNSGGLKELTSLLEEEGVYEELIALAKYEYLRINDASYEVLIDVLHTYLKLEYNERYLLLLAEHYIQKGEEENARCIVKEMLRNFPTGAYMQQSKALLEAIESGTSKEYIKNNSICSELYEQISIIQNSTNGHSYIADTNLNGNQKYTREKSTINVNDGIEINKQPIEKKAGFMSLSKAFDMMKKVKKRAINEEPIPIEERFEGIVGMADARNELSNLYRLLCLQNERRRSNFNNNLIKTTHFAICGKSGTGKTILASIIGKLLFDFGIRELEDAILIEAKDIEKNIENLYKLSGSVLIIENIEKCMDSQGSYASIAWLIYCLMNQRKDNISVIITGSTEGIQNLLMQEDGIRELLYTVLKIPDYSLDEIMEIAKYIVKRNRFVLSDMAATALRRNMDKESRQPYFKYGDTIEQSIDAAIRRMADRYAVLEDTTDEDLAKLIEDDFDFTNDKEESLEELLNQLDCMTGLNAVKNEVHHRINAIIAQKQAEKAGAARKGGFGTLHMVFQGGPGTGKTTVARTIGKIYQQIGVLPSGDIFVECTRKDLVGQYLGHTAKQVQAKVKEAMGGVLFIDEAYSLCTGDNDTFGKEAVDTLIAEMENYRDSLMVIFAGYTSAMNKFLNANEGLRSRISRYITFEDYTIPEMISIYKGMVKSKNMYLDVDTQDVLTDLIKKKSKQKDFGNARGVRNLLEKTIEALNERIIVILNSNTLIGKNEYDIIKAEDIRCVLNKKTQEEKSLEELLEKLDALTGLASVKKEIRQKVNKILVTQKAESLGVRRQEGFGTLHMIFKGNPGTGKTTIARLVGSIYKQLGILPEGNKIIECSRNELVSDIVGRTSKCVKSKIEEAMGGVLFIDEAYTLSRDDNDQYGQEAIDALVADMENYRDNFMVILAGYSKEMDQFLAKNPGLSSRISNHITFEDYTTSELISIWKGMVESNGMFLNGVEDSLLQDLMKQKSQTNDFGNARGVRNVFYEVTAALDNRLEQNLNDSLQINKEDFVTISPEDITACMKQSTNDNESMESLLNQLNALTGLTSVKEKVIQMVNIIKAKKIMEERGIRTTDSFGTLHLVFKGNAGTGKTTVARLIGKIYNKLGVLKNGEVFVECSRQDLVAGYMGQTSLKVKEKVNQALGGILFIDEAYSLKQGEGDSYGQEAIDTLVAEVENRRDELMVIIAGYSSEMDKFLASNQGLESRFSNEIIFEDYSADEMLSIFKYQAELLNIIIPTELEPGILGKIVYTMETTTNFGNARGVRNLVEKANGRRMFRIAESAAKGIELTTKEMMILTEDDML